MISRAYLKILLVRVLTSPPVIWTCTSSSGREGGPEDLGNLGLVSGVGTGREVHRLKPNFKQIKRARIYELFLFTKVFYFAFGVGPVKTLRTC